MVEMIGSSDERLSTYLDERRSLRYLLRHLNRRICDVGRGKFLMTFSTALIDTRRGQLTYACAGHEAPLLIPGDPHRDIEPLHTGPSRRLGEHADAEFQQSTYAFNSSDTVVWYTDGLIEMLNPKQRPYGDGRLMRALRKARGRTVDKLAEGILGDVRRFAGESEPVDDLTLVVVRRGPESSPVKKIRHELSPPRVDRCSP